MKNIHLIALIIVIIFMIFAIMPFTKDFTTIINSPIIDFYMQTNKTNVQSLDR